MIGFLAYEAKVAALLCVFYLLYRLLLRGETFHRFNRKVLALTLLLSFILPLIRITIYLDPDYSAVLEEAYAAPTATEATASAVETAISSGAPWWAIALFAILVAGAAVSLILFAISVLKVRGIISRGERHPYEEGITIVSVKEDISPFSWMKYIVLSEDDYRDICPEILEHEKAHIRLAHSWEILLVEILSSLQWFNPAMWLIKSEVHAIHEFEADRAVLESGADRSSYQKLLIRKAVSESAIAIVNGFHQGALRPRIDMMLRKASSSSRKLRFLYVIPVILASVSLNAKTRYATVQIPQRVHSIVYIVDGREVDKAVFDSLNPYAIEKRDMDFSGVSDDSLSHVAIRVSTRPDVETYGRDTYFIDGHPATASEFGKADILHTLDMTSKKMTVHYGFSSGFQFYVNGRNASWEEFEHCATDPSRKSFTVEYSGIARVYTK